MKNKLLYLAIVIALFICLTACSSNENFSEKKLQLFKYNPQKEMHGNLFLNENEELSVYQPIIGWEMKELNIINNKSKDLEISEDIKDAYYFETTPNIFTSTNGNIVYLYNSKNFENVYLRGLTAEKDIVYEIQYSEILELENVVASIDLMDTIQVLDNGFIGIINYYKKNSNNICIIDPYKKEIIKSCYIELENLVFKELIENEVIFFDRKSNKILLFDISTGVMKYGLSVPGSSKYGDVLECGGITEYDEFIYTFNKTGIYRAKKESMVFELLIDSCDTKYLNSKIEIFGDIVVKSEKEIYISLFKGTNDEGTWVKEYIVEYLIK